VVLFAGRVPAANVAHPGRLPAQGLDVVAFPMKIGGGSGGPVRIGAIVR
jgi:kynurenine formamidase